MERTVNEKKKTGIRIVAVFLILVLILFLLQRLFVPKYMGDVIEGRFVGEYYREEDKSFDVIFVGDCEVYENFSPVVLWQDYGIHSYIRGSAQQYIWQSYYLLEDTLRYHTPKVVVFNIQSLQYDESQSEAYNRMTLEGMRWSPAKVDSIRASMTEEEHFIEYVFPLLRYHDRWNDLSADDVRYMFHTEPATFNGYYMRTDVLPAENVPEGRPLEDYAFGDRAWEYLEKMRLLCEENGITLILTKAPSLWPYWYDEYEEQVEEYASAHELTYINFLELQEETDIDYSTDTYDGGLHMNLTGAEKLSRYIGPILLKAGACDRRNEAGLAKIWEEETVRYNAAAGRMVLVPGKERMGAPYCN